MPALDVRLNPIRDTQDPSKEGAHRNKNKIRKQEQTIDLRKNNYIMHLKPLLYYLQDIRNVLLK